ncbi:MAG: heme ABC exporter ATP-binding protein CcmA [Beijerinckiaceae bacterium]
MTAPLCLIAETLACEKGERLLFRDLSFTLEHGSGLIVTGQNGVGKTSLLRILAGLALPASGTLRIANAPSDKPLSEHVHFLGGKDGLKAALTAREHIAFWSRFYGAQAGFACETMLQTLFLTQQADVPAGVLSSGQRRRLAFGLALLVPRPVWLLDEPMNALDPEMRERFMSVLIAQQLAKGGIVIASTHLPLGVPGLHELAFAPDGTHVFKRAVL